MAQPNSIFEAVRTYVLWTNAGLKCLYKDNANWKRILPTAGFVLEPSCAEIMQEYLGVSM